MVFYLGHIIQLTRTKKNNEFYRDTGNLILEINMADILILCLGMKISVLFFIKHVFKYIRDDIKRKNRRGVIEYAIQV